MMRIRAFLLAGLIALVPLTDAAAQSRGRDRDRDQDRREQPRAYPGQGQGPGRGQAQQRDRQGPREAPRSAPRADPGDIARRVQSGRPGRMLGVQQRGGDYVVRWEYPGGRVSDIQVDGQSGRVRGDD